MKMKMVGIVLIIIGVLVALLISAYAYYGGFKTINIYTENQGGEVIVYENAIGDYKNSAQYTDRIYYELLNNDQVETTKGIGIYYDNPRIVDKEKLRSDVGCILDNPDDSTIARLSAKYQLKTLPKGNFIISEFPMKGGLSFMIGAMKVYPALIKYSEENNLKESPVTEIYDVPNQKIIYRREILK